MYAAYERSHLEERLKEVIPGVYRIAVEEFKEFDAGERSSKAIMLVYKQEDDVYGIISKNSSNRLLFTLDQMVNYFTTEIVESDDFVQTPGNLTVSRVCDTEEEYRANKDAYDDEYNKLIAHPEMLIDLQSAGVYVVRDRNTNGRPKPSILYIKWDNKIIQVIPSDVGDWEFVPRTSSFIITEAAIRYKGIYSIYKLDLD